MSGLICAGNVHIALLNDDGSFAGFLDIKNTTRLALSAGEGEEKQRISKQRESYGQVLDSVIIPAVPTVALTFDEADAETVGMALLGTLSPINLTSQTRAGVDLDVPALGVWLELGDRYINPTGFELAASGGTPVLVQGVDYVVDLTMGLVKFLPAGSVDVDDVVEKSYTTRAITGTRIQASRKNQLKARVLLNGKNLADGRGIVIEVPQCTLKSASEFDALSSEFVVTEVNGSIIGDYSVDYLTTAI